MENAAEGSGVEFWMLGGVDARLKKRLKFSTPGWWRNKVSVCGNWATAGRAKFVSGGFWPTVA